MKASWSGGTRGVQMSFDIPVLLLTWRRPDTTRQVLDALRLVAPSKLYVASDGPRNESEAKAVQATRDLISEHIDWPCQLKIRFQSENQGCQLGVSSAITWFFEQEEEGIVLEDDCVPHSDFFSYCSELLERYRHDTRIWCISGDNFQDGVWRGEGSYYFSRYNHCWGWASWRRCWSKYTTHETLWEQVSTSLSHQKAMFEDPLERRYWMEIWDNLFSFGLPDSWAYRWFLVCISNSGLTVLPNRNLVTNIGFGADSTHTKDSRQSIKSTGLDRSLVHPTLIVRNSLADSYSFMNHFGGTDYQRSTSILWRFLYRQRLMLVKPLHYPKKLLSKVLSFVGLFQA